MSREYSLTNLAKRRRVPRYKMTVESTSAATIRDALPMFPNAILIKTHRGLMIAVPEPENNSGNGLDL